MDTFLPRVGTPPNPILPTPQVCCVVSSWISRCQGSGGKQRASGLVAPSQILHLLNGCALG